MDHRIRHIIIEYGSHILCSEEFRQTFDQTHHLNRTVGEHTLGVVAEAVRLCLVRDMTDAATLKNVVIASLCHDLGIMGRHDKFRNNVQCLIRHPLDSVGVYRRLTGENDERVIDSIRCHMFPLKPCIPKYREGWVLTLADKIGASREKLGIPLVSDRDRDELLAMAHKRTGLSVPA